MGTSAMQAEPGMLDKDRDHEEIRTILGTCRTMHYGGRLQGIEGGAPGVLGAFSEARPSSDSYCGERVVGDREYSCVALAVAVDIAVLC